MDVHRFLFDRGKWSLRPVGFYRKLRTSPEAPVSFSPDARLLAYGRRDGTVVLAKNPLAAR
jgi:hypothetical protein